MVYGVYDLPLNYTCTHTHTHTLCLIPHNAKQAKGLKKREKKVQLTKPLLGSCKVQEMRLADGLWNWKAIIQ
jgi:hypothetical protein